MLQPRVVLMACFLALKPLKAIIQPRVAVFLSSRRAVRPTLTFAWHKAGERLPPAALAFDHDYLVGAYLEEPADRPLLGFVVISDTLSCLHNFALSLVL